MMWRMYYAVLCFISPLAQNAFRLFNAITHQQRAKIILVDEDNKLLLVQNALGDRCWTLPGGGIEEGESAIEAAIREVYEELSIVLDAEDCRRIGMVHVTKNSYDAQIIACCLNSAQKRQIWPHKLEIYAVEWHSASKLPQATQPIVAEAYALLSREGSIGTIV